MLERFYALGWAKRIGGLRVIKFSPEGENV